MDDAAAPLRVTLDQRRADDWALALASAGIDSRIDASAAGYRLLVPAAERIRADFVLDAFDAENLPPPVHEPEEFDTDGFSRAAFVVAALLCIAFVVTGPGEWNGIWFTRGAATAWRISQGEVWRAVTALTLHANFPHLVANAATLMIFGTALCGLVGAGVGIWVLLLAGTAGNWITALLHGSAHNAIGASTAIFGGIGALAAIQLIRRRRGARVSAWKAWAPLAAGLGLLGFLGTGPQSDVLAHLFGFAIGALLGPPALRAAAWRERHTLQLALSIAAGAAVVACWIAAFTRP
jgi:membrane associated rhomboid family serine protease